MDSEALAVAKIQAMVARCPHLKPFIASNDKTPFTDGHIDVYSGLGQKKVDWLGRVSVQVKGRSRSGKQAAQVSFGISRVDLLGFQRDAGVLYFYVAIDRHGRCSPYYAILSPFKIEHLLRSAPKHQATISVPFKRFPHLPAEIEPIVGLALKTRDQRPSLGYDAELFEKMQSLTIHLATQISLDAPLWLTPDELDYAIEITTEGGMTLPLGGELQIYPEGYTERPTNIAIGAGGVTYEHVSSRRVDAETVEVRLGPAMTLTMGDTGTQRVWNVSYTAPGNFVERLKATRFLIGLVEQQGIEINGNPSPLGDPTGEIADHLDDLRSQLLSLSELEDLFSRLEINGALVDLDEIDADAFRSLKMLHDAFVDDKELRNQSGETARGLIHFGRWAVMVMTVPGGQPGTWRYVDPFDPAAPHMFRWSAEDDINETIPVTAYDIVEQEHLPTILNLRLDRIVEAYEPIADSASTARLANQRVLALVLAADACDERRGEFLRAASLLNEWIIAHEGEEPVHLINRWQILKRTSGLTPQHLDAIRTMKRKAGRLDATMADEIELSCALLLGDTQEANYLIGQIEEEKLATIRTWPIWSLRGSPLATDA